MVTFYLIQFNTYCDLSVSYYFSVLQEEMTWPVLVSSFSPDQFAGVRKLMLEVVLILTADLDHFADARKMVLRIILMLRFYIPGRDDVKGMVGQL